MPIDVDEAKRKVEEYIAQINVLLKKSYKEGADKKQQLDTAIQNFIKVALADGKEKWDSYRRSVHFTVAILGHEDTEEEKQEDYVSRLKKMRNHLTAYKEELELRLASTRKSSKLDKIEEKTQRHKAEAERRASVVDEKRWGAAIELIDMFRTELKERDRLNQRLIDLQKDVRDIGLMDLKKDIKDIRLMLSYLIKRNG